jgi:predicted DNA-binding protein
MWLTFDAAASKGQARRMKDHMAQTRVLSIRFTDDEYQALQALSMVTGKPVNAIVRDAVNEKADRAGNDPEILQMAEEAKKRLEEADRALRDRLVSSS